MMTTKNNVAMRELNDNVDQKNLVIISISLCLRMKIFFFRACIKEDAVLLFFTLGFIFGHISGIILLG